MRRPETGRTGISVRDAHEQIKENVMNRWKIVLTVLFACALGLTSSLTHAQELNADMMAKIEAATATPQPRVKPATPHKVLVFNLCNGFVHSAIPYCAKALELMGAKSGAFEVVSSDDVAMFEPANLAQFDAVIMNNTTGELFLPKGLGNLSQEAQQAARERDAALKKSLMDFVRGGKGIVGIHAATDCFYQWADYGEMMGGYFHGHPWNEDVGMKLDDPAHPLLKAFKGRGFTIADEIYQFREPYSRKNLRVLLSIDTNKTDMNKGDRIHRDDNDFAVTWVRSWGKGRVFYCSLGHREEIFWNTAILQHYLDGIQFALGDIEADTTPSAKLSAKYLEESRQQMAQAVVAEALQEVAAYEFGTSREALTVIQEAVTQTGGSAPAQEPLAKQLAAFLSTDATLAGKQFACRQLSLIGSKESVPALAGMLTADDTTAMARYALQRISDASAEQALTDALDKTSGGALVGMINSLGERATLYKTSPPTVDKLVALLQNADATLAEAAAAALGKIGGPAATKGLAEARASVAAELRPAVGDAYLLCADKLLAAGDSNKAAAIYKELTAPTEAEYVRMAATKGLMAALGGSAPPQIVAVLAGDEYELKRAAAAAARTVPGSAATKALADALPSLPPDSQALLLYALKDRGDGAALAAVSAMTKSADGAVRLAALQCIASIGDASSVPLLAKAATAGEDAERNTANQALAGLPDAAVNAAIVAEIAKVDAPVRVQLVERLADRNAADSVPALLKSATDADESVRAASLGSLSRLAGASEVPALVDLLAAEQGGNAREAAVGAVVNAAKRIPDGTKRAAAVLTKLPAVTAPEAKSALVKALGQIADKSALPALVAAAKDADTQVHTAAFSALAEWPTADPLDDVLALSESISDAGQREAALRACVRMMVLATDRPAAARVAAYEKALALAKTDAEKNLVITGLGEVGDPQAIPVLLPCAKQDSLAAAANETIEKLKKISYKVSASHGSGEAGKAIDGDMGTRWTSGTSMAKGMWFLIDLLFEQKVSRLVLDAGSSTGDYPRGYEVYISNSKDDWGAPVATGEGKAARVEITFEPKSGRYVKVVQTGAHGMYWSIHELSVESE
jgi:type 1 glutamine amidotransferase/HEAT repeat protein